MRILISNRSQSAHIIKPITVKLLARYEVVWSVVHEKSVAKIFVGSTDEQTERRTDWHCDCSIARLSKWGLIKSRALTLKTLSREVTHAFMTSSYWNISKVYTNHSNDTWVTLFCIGWSFHYTFLINFLELKIIPDSNKLLFTYIQN